MKHGNIELYPSAVIKNLKAETLAADPVDLSNGKARIWFNDTEKKLKYYDGTETHIIAVGGSLADYIRHDGTVAMTADLELSSADQSGGNQTTAISKGHLETELAKKEEVLTGAASTIAHTNLGVEKVVVSDAAGKVIVSGISTAELNQLAGLSSNIVDELESKEDNLGFVPLDVAGTNTMTAALTLGNNLITGVQKGVEADHAVNLSQMENAMAGLDFQKDVNDVQVDATLVPVKTEGFRYVLTDIDNLHADFGTIAGLEANDIVEFDGAEFVVAYDVSVYGEGALVWNMENNEYVRWDGVSWDKFGGLSGVNAGTCLVKDGDTISIMLGSGVAEGADSKLAVAVHAGGSVQLVDPTTGLASSAANAVVGVKLANESLATGVAGLKVKAQGIAAAELHADVAGFGLQGANGVALGVLAEDASILVAAEGIKLNEAHTDGIYARQDGAEFTAEITVVDATADGHAMPKSQIEATITSMAGDKVDAFAARFEASYDSYTSETPSMIHDFAHSVGTVDVQVVCYDEDNNMFIPNSIETVDADNVRVNVSELINCRIVVQGMKPAAVA